jgi:hypothetical protein
MMPLILYIFSVLVRLLITVTNNWSFKGGKIYFGLWFPKFQSKINWIYCFGPKVRQNIMAVGAWDAYLSHGDEEGERERIVGWEQCMSF